MDETIISLKGTSHSDVWDRAVHSGFEFKYIEVPANKRASKFGVPLAARPGLHRAALAKLVRKLKRESPNSPKYEKHSRLTLHNGSIRKKV